MPESKLRPIRVLTPIADDDRFFSHFLSDIEESVRDRLRPELVGDAGDAGPASYEERLVGERERLPEEAWGRIEKARLRG